MTKKSIQKNINILNSIRDRNRNRAPTSTLQKINNIISLYEDRKITQLTTAENLIKGIATNNEKQKAKGMKQYEKAVEKYESATPITERMAKTAEKAREGKTIKKVKVRLTGKTKASLASRLVRIARERGIGNKRKSYSVEYMLYSTEVIGEIKRGKKINGLIYYPMFSKGQSRIANLKVDAFIETLVKRTITKQFEKPLFRKVMMFLKTDLQLRDMMPDMIDYIDVIQILKVIEVDDDGKDYDIEDEGLKDTTNISIYNFYHQTLIDTERETVKEAIQNNNHKENECWINHLLETYEGTELAREKRGSLAKTLSRKKILELLKTTEEDIHEYGISINNMKKVFQFFNLPVKLYNYQCQLIFQYFPSNYTKGHSKRIFTALIKNNHIYPINANQDRLSQVDGKEKSLDIKVSKNFYITDKTAPPKYKMFSHIDELLKLTDQDEYYLIHKDNNLMEVLYQFKKVGYEPYIRYRAGKISDLKIKFTYKSADTRKIIRRKAQPYNIPTKTLEKDRTVNYIISTQDLSKDTLERDIDADTEEKYNRIAEAMFVFNKKLFSSSHMSQYDDVDIEILDECRTVVPLGYLDKNVDVENLVEIDRSKAFTWAFNQISKIPIFNAFDSWKAWDGTLDINKLSSLTLYKVEVLKGNMFFNKKFNIIYGKFLRKMDLSNIKIIYYKIPSYIHKVNYKSIVDELWETKLGDDEEDDKQIKKKIANINFGMLEKSNNTSQRSDIFNSLKEACYYQRKQGGRIYALEEDIHERDEEEERRHKGDTYFVLNTTVRQKLVNGFRYIKELLLQYHNYAMYEAYTKLEAKGVKVYSVKSDAFTIHQEDLSKVRPNPNHFIKSYREGILNFEKAIGNWRVSTSRINYPTEKYKFKYNKLIQIPLQENEALDVIDEWDTEAVCKQIIPNSPCMIRAKFAGSGKSYIGQYLNKMGYNVLFAVPHNRLSQEIEGKATTLNMFFSIPVNKGDDLPCFDHSDYNVIFFDEIFMSNIYIYNKISEFVKNNPDKIIIGAGDTKQLPPINDLTNTQPHDQYADQCIDKIFKYSMYLKICKRVGEEDRIKLDEMYNDFWERNMPLKDFIEKYFRYTSKINPEHMNIAYTNIRCKSVSDEVRKKLGKKGLYEVGEEMICRLYLKTDEGAKFNANIRYKILCINSSGIIIENIKDKKKYTLTEELLNKHFRYGYCATCHSCQGASINNNITIHEWDRSYLVSREWVWTSLTRARDFNKVAFFKNEKAEEKMEQQLLINYLKNKIDGYKKQDLKAGRELNENNFVDVNFCMERLKGTCQKCGGDFHIEIKKGTLSSNFTCQRVDNNFSHTKDNCVAYCNYCNCSSK